MPEGDTLYRTAAALRPSLLGRRVLAAQARQPGPAIQRVVGAAVTVVEARGKHLIVRFDNGLALHTHLRMTGSWHRYAPGEPWRKPAHYARVALTVGRPDDPPVPESVVVCFSAPIVELLDDRLVDRHPSIEQLGPDLLAPVFDRAEALRRLRHPARADLTLGEALLDQRAFAGVGNIFKSEILFVERLDPWQRVHDTDDATLERLLATAERLLRVNVQPEYATRITTDGSALARGSPLWVYGRGGRPCFRCRTPIASRLQGEQARRTYWCPRCQEGGFAGT